MDCEGSFKALYERDSNTINLIHKNLTSTAQAESVLVHELTHSLQNCYDSAPDGEECFTSLKREIEAYAVSGQCKKTKIFRSVLDGLFPAAAGHSLQC